MAALISSVLFVSSLGNSFVVAISSTNIEMTCSQNGLFALLNDDLELILISPPDSGSSPSVSSQLFSASPRSALCSGLGPKFQNLGVLA